MLRLYPFCVCDLKKLRQDKRHQCLADRMPVLALLKHHKAHYNKDAALAADAVYTGYVRLLRAYNSDWPRN